MIGKLGIYARVHTQDPDVWFAYQSGSQHRVKGVTTDGTEIFHSGTTDFNDSIRGIVTKDGNCYCSGNFTQYKGVTQSYFTSINPDGNILNGFNNEGFDDPPLGNITKPIRIINDQLYVAASGYGGRTTSNTIITVLDFDGSYDTVINASSYVSDIRSFYEYDDYLYIVGGVVGKDGICKYNLNTNSFDSTFQTNIGGGFNNNPSDIYVDASGVYVLGIFSSLDGTSYEGIVGLNHNGTVNTSFDTISTGNGFNGTGAGYVVKKNGGNVYCGGNFTSYKTSATNTALRCIDINSSNGNQDFTFVDGIGFDDVVYDLTVDTNGDIYFGGAFNSFDGTSRPGIARINSNGTVDTAFNASMGTSTQVVSIALNENIRQV